MLDKDKVEIYQALHTMFWQSIFSICSIIAFFIVLPRYLNAKNAFDLTKYSAMEGFLVATVYLAFKYWFYRKKDE